jgi:DNA-binding transcriptional LysR family regulator
MTDWPDPAHLHTFVAIAEARSFSEAGRRLGLSQPTISDHVKKLEAFAGRRLILRDTHSNALTEEGQAMLEFARTILDANSRARRHFAKSVKRRLFRLGVSEDLTIGWLQEAIRSFIEAHADVDLEFTIALSRKLVDEFEGGALDMVICKRWPDSELGELIFRDRVVWAAATPAPVFRDDEAQLVLYPPPSMTRVIAPTALERAGIPWRIACTSGDLNGLVTATSLGLGMMAHASTLIPAGLRACDADPRLPELGATEFTLLQKKGADRALCAEMREAMRARRAADVSLSPSAARR